MQKLIENELFVIDHDAPRKLVIMRRKGLRIMAVNWDQILDDVLAAIHPARGQRLFLDVRLAPGNNDPKVEQKIQQFRRELTALFPLTATLVGTAVGRLQVLRMSRERGEPENHVFLDEAEAIAYLQTQNVVAPSR